MIPTTNQIRYAMYLAKRMCVDTPNEFTEERRMNDFEKQIHAMFDHIWDCDINHPIFDDTVGELMNAVIQCYNNLPSAESDTHDNARKTHACVSPCDICRHYPPSSADGKPCSMCPAEGRSE